MIYRMFRAPQDAVAEDQGGSGGGYGLGAHAGLRDAGTVDRDLLARNEYLAAENRILKAQL